MSIEAMKMALAKLDHLWEICVDERMGTDVLPEIKALRQAIEQAEKPCKTGSQCIGGKCPECEREWVGLTDEDFYGQSQLQVMAMKYAEAKLKEKNGG
jgi:hypothetical protein